MSTTPPLQAWKELRHQIAAADEAAKLAFDGDGSNGERPYRTGSPAANPYPATVAMRKNGGWDGPLTDPHRLRTKDAKAVVDA